MSEMWSPEIRELSMTYRRVFNTPDGKIVLKDILEDLKHFDSAQNQEDTILQNYAKVILYKLGAYLDQNEDALVNMYCGFNLPERENKENS